MLEQNTQEHAGRMLHQPSNKVIQGKAGHIIYFLSHPIQYFSPLLKQLSLVTDLKVYYFSDSSVKGGLDKGFGKSIAWDTPLLEGYTSNFLKNKRTDRGLNNKFLDVWNPGVWKVIRRSSADIIIVNGWVYSSNWLAMLAARLSGKKVWLRAENPLNQEIIKSKKTLFVKKIILKHLLFRLFVNKCLYIGKGSKAFFEYYGVPEKKLLYTPYAVDNSFFSKKWLEVKDRLFEIKTQLGLPVDKKIILFSGKYIEKKRPLDLLKAFAALDPARYFLVMAGDGALRPEMERFIQSHNMKNVLLTGFVNQSQIPLYYASADVFVMCSGSGETWGLSVNEAMNFSKPVIVSATCGSSEDLVQHGENGFIFEEGNTDQLTTYLKTLLEDDSFRERAGRRSAEIISSFSIERIVENIHAEIKSS